MSTDDPLTIGLFGYYGFGNWGDELMCMLFTRILMRRGHEVKVFAHRADASYIDDIPAPRTDDVRAFLRNVDLLVYGGGGVLATAARKGSPFWRSLTGILEGSQERDIPVIAVSIGGFGMETDALPELARHLVEHVERASVRNPQDLEAFAEDPSRAFFCHDVLWLGPRFFPVRKRRTSTFTIGVNLPRHRSLDRWSRLAAFLFDRLLRLVIFARRDLRFLVIDTNMTSESERWHPYGPNAEYHRFGDPESDFRIIETLDLILSSKLHFGLLGMASGIPFYSLDGQEKTRMMLQNIGLEGHYYPLWKSLFFLLRFLSPFFPRKVPQEPGGVALSELTASAAENIEFLEEYVARISRPGSRTDVPRDP